MCMAVEPAFKAPFKPHRFSHTSYISLIKISTFNFLYPFASLERPGIKFLLKNLSYNTIFHAVRPKCGLKLFNSILYIYSWQSGEGVTFTREHSSLMKKKWSGKL